MLHAHHISDLAIESLRRELRRYATTRRLDEMPDDVRAAHDPFGVAVLYSNRNPHVVRFSGVTADDVQWAVEVDFRVYSRDYHDQLITSIGESIDARRRERRGESSPIIITH